MRTQTETITIRLTPEEKELLERLKKESDSPSMRKFILDMCVRGKVVVNSDLREARKQPKSADETLPSGRDKSRQS